MIIFLIGPTGVGKSTALEALKRKFSSINCQSLDILVQEKDAVTFRNCGTSTEGSKAFWDAAESILKGFEANYNSYPDDNVVVIDVGAGALLTEEAYEFFKKRSHEVVVLYAQPNEVFERVRLRSDGPWNTKPFKEFEDNEYSALRQKFYGLGRLCDVSGLSEESACNRFLDIIDRIFSMFIHHEND